MKKQKRNRLFRILKVFFKRKIKTDITRKTIGFFFLIIMGLFLALYRPNFSNKLSREQIQEANTTRIVVSIAVLLWAIVILREIEGLKGKMGKMRDNWFWKKLKE